MPRRPRFHLAGVPLHVVQRGHNRAPCFFRDEDFHSYLHWLREALDRTGCSLHAFVLMTNHVHLLLTPQDADSVSKLVVILGTHYVRYINRVRGRTGTLWDSRYKSSLVQTETYVLACQRYIELNPVRAAIVAHPAQYRWSSFRCHALGERSPMLTPRPEYLALGSTAAERQTRYRHLVEAALEEDALQKIRRSLNEGRPLGDARFESAVELATGRRVQPRARGRPRTEKIGA